jgi:transcription elongation factor Elf1
MEEVEKFFKCPFCLEKISMLLDLSQTGDQTYIEDCEVCCNPIQISYISESSKVKSFKTEKAYG